MAMSVMLRSQNKFRGKFSWTNDRIDSVAEFLFLSKCALKHWIHTVRMADQMLNYITCSKQTFCIAMN